MDIDIFEVLRAKSPDKEGTAETLKTHVKNALDRVIEFYNFITSMEVDWRTFKEKGEQEIFFKNLTKVVILHDFGKIDYQFQWYLFQKDEKENNAGWLRIKDFFSNDIKKVHFPRHEILSSIFASFLLDEGDWSKKIMTAILLHHYNKYFTDIPSLPVIIRDFEEDIEGYMKFVSEKKEILKKSYDKFLSNLFSEFPDITFIQEAMKELKRTANWDKAEKLLNSYLDDDLSEFVDFYEPKNNLSNETGELSEDTYKFLVFLGALRRADYSSSGGVDIEYKDNYPPAILKFDELARKFKDKFHISVLWQEEILKDKNPDEIRHLILIAPTGSGKTEFSILWAAKNPRKFLYTLPLRVALNDLFIRFKRTTEKGKGYFNNEEVNILHSTAFIEYVRESEGKYLDIDRKITSSKLLSYPLMFTTPDQIFLTSLNYYGSDKILSVYPTSSIVIDEIQTFNPEMAAIIIKTLRVIKHLEGNILVMTATFPPYFGKFLDDLKFKKIDISEKGEKDEIKNYSIKRHRIEIIEENLFEYKEKEGNKGYNVDIANGGKTKITELLTNKRNSLIVVNNVKKAISIYKYLKDLKKNGYKVFLLHSRLIEKYKTERISEIKEGLKNKEKVIVVTTQIIEASVDFDFDFMITELSTIDSQIQRWGRVYRRRESSYNGDEPNVVVFVGEIDGSKLSIDRGTNYIYDKEVLESTRDILKEYQDKVLSYKEEKEMVEKTFAKEINGVTLKEKYEKDIEDILKFLNYFSASKKSEAQKIFRRMAGFNAVVPALMKEDGRKWVEKLAEIIEDGSDISWKEIEGKTGKNRWVLKAEIYNYSVPMPEFTIKKYSWYLSKEFKGFRVLTVKEGEINNIKNYGLDGWFQGLEDGEFESEIL